MSWRESMERGEHQRQKNRGAAAGLARARPGRPGVSRPKPLHWAQMLWWSAAIGAVVGAIGTLVVAGTGGEDVLVRVMAWMIVGCLAGLIVVSILERVGVFKRTDE